MAPREKYLLNEEDERKVQAFIFQARDQVTYNNVEVTPGMAKVLLSRYNDLNRPLDSSTYLSYACQMIDGQWLKNGEPLIISDQGNVLDGQHRLRGCIEAEISFITDIRTGVDEQAHRTIDTGRKRSAGNVLSIHSKLTGQGFPYHTTVMAAASLVLDYLMSTIRKKGSGGSRVSNHSKLEYVLENPLLVTWVEKVKDLKGPYGTYASQIAAVCYLGAKKHESKAAEFAHGIMTGENLPPRSPILALQRRLPTVSRDRSVKYADSLHRWQKLAVTALAWNYHVLGESRDLLKLPQDNEVPMILGSEDEPRIWKIDVRSRMQERANLNQQLRVVNK